MRANERKSAHEFISTRVKRFLRFELVHNVHCTCMCRIRFIRKTYHFLLSLLLLPLQPLLLLLLFFSPRHWHCKQYKVGWTDDTECESKNWLAYTFHITVCVYSKEYAYTHTCMCACWRKCFMVCVRVCVYRIRRQNKSRLCVVRRGCSGTRSGCTLTKTVNRVKTWGLNV